MKNTRGEREGGRQPHSKTATDHVYIKVPNHIHINHHIDRARGYSPEEGGWARGFSPEEFARERYSGHGHCPRSL